MKQKILILPILALVFVVGWSGSNHYSASELEKDSEAIKARLSARLPGTGADALTAITQSSGQLNPLKKLATLMEDVQRTGSKLAGMRLEQHCKGMTKEELISALDEIDRSPTSNRWSEVKAKLFLQLCKKDPATALARFADPSRNDRRMMSDSLTSAMTEWPQKDLAMAESWLAKQVAAGVFDSATYNGENRALMEFEDGLVVAQIVADPTTATARLTALSAEQRSSCLWAYAATPIGEENQAALSKLVREFMPEDEWTRFFSIFASHLGSEAASKRVLGKSPILDWYHFPSDYTPVTNYLDRIGVTPAEREKCVEQTILAKLNVIPLPHVSMEQIDTLHAWATEQAPSKADNLTSQILWHKTRRGASFAQVAEQAVRYSNASGNDNLIFEFLTQPVPAADQNEARLLAEKIMDPARRQIVLDALKK